MGIVETLLQTSDASNLKFEHLILFVHPTLQKCNQVAYFCEKSNQVTHI